MSSLVGTFRLWRMLTAPTPAWMRRLTRAHANIRDGAGLINDLLPDPA